MAELDKPNSHLTTVKWRFPSVHPEGRKFTLVAGFLALIGFTVLPDAFGWLLAGLTIWVAAFFRDPMRTTPTDPKLIVAPADGLVTMISRVAAPLELAGETGLSGDYTRVSIFMSVFDVHINRSPVAGTVRRIAYIPGKFLNADLDKASEDNERQHFLVEREDGVRIGFTQIAGLVARRIMSFVKEGDRVEAGERIGLIRFGSRVDVYLPAGTGSQVLLGQRTIAGETVLGEIGVDPQRSGISQ
jgi:phosphatidylserine decarboxylase